MMLDFGLDTVKSTLSTWTTKIAKSPQRIEAERLCQEFTGTASRTLAKRLSDSHQITLEQARTIIRSVRGNHGEKSKKTATSPRPNGHAGTKPTLPPSIADPWKPFELGNGIKVAILSDLHVPYHSEVAVPSAVKYCVSRSPGVVLINGDLADFYSISRHQKDPSKRDFKAEVTAVQKTLEWIRSEFPEARIVLKAGNHEERWQHWLWNCAPEISNFERMTLEQWIDAPEHGIEVVTDQRPVMCGRLPVMHGHEIGKGISAPVNAARGLFLRTTSTMLQSHCHRTSQHVEPDWRHLDTATWSIGCLCDMNPEYARINKWNHGFGFVTVDDAGEFHVENLRLSVSGDLWR